MRTVLFGAPHGFADQLQAAVPEVVVQVLHRNDADPTDFRERAALIEGGGTIACIWVAGLPSLSLFFSCLHLLAEGQLETLLAFTSISLDVPMRYGDAWEMLRVDELKETGRLAIFESPDNVTVQTVVDYIMNHSNA